MNYTRLLAALVISAIPAGLCAQSAIDAYQIMPNQLNGTARFQSMGGAFTALGGDISTLGQNPAGIGVYRSSEIGISADVDCQRATTESNYENFRMTQTKGAFSNAGYVGSTSLGSQTMPYFSWGVSYNRNASFNRVYSGYSYPVNTSLTNYIAAFSDGYTEKQLLETSSYNPYYSSDCDYLSILAYNSGAINPVGGDMYKGLYQNGTDADAGYTVQEKGHIDEYNIDFGGNIMNTVYWGLGFGITDLDYTRMVYYDESMSGAAIPTSTRPGNAYFGLSNWKRTSGSGFNVKFGLIFRPINEFRVGVAFHTPTWYSLSTDYNATSYYTYSQDPIPDNAKHTENWTDTNGFDWRLRSPWRLMIGAAAVLGRQFILSADYEYQAYNNMSVRVPMSGFMGGSFTASQATNNEISDYFQSANIVRIGAEWRALSWLSLRAGYNVQTSNVSNSMKNNQYEVYTSGTDPSYDLDNTIQHITAGIGLRYQAFYFDMAYVHKNRESDFHAYTNYDGLRAPQCKVKDANNKVVFSLGFKF